MREIARLLLPSIRWDPVFGIATARPAVERALDAGVGGFVLERAPRDALSALTDFVRARADEAPVLAIDLLTLDAEDRAASRLSIPPLAALASLRDALCVRQAARTAARQVRAVGCNAMLAPSCDVAPTRRGSAFRDDPSAVAVAASEWVDAAQADGVLCCAGEFPGIGRLTGTDLGLPVVREAEDALYAADLVPFRAAIDAGVAGMMVATAAYPALDPTGVAAVLSPTIIARVLRNQLGFEGLVMADSTRLDAGMGRDVAARDLVVAGVDLVLRPVRVDVELRALMDAVADRHLDGERVTEVARRRRERAELAGAPDASGAASAADRAWLDELAERTIAVVRGRAVRIAPSTEVTVLNHAPEARRSLAASFTTGIGEAGGAADGVRHVAVPSATTRTAFVVVVAPGPSQGQRHEAIPGARATPLAALCAEASRVGRDVAVIWCGHPATAPDAPDADLVVACWCPSAAMVRAAARWLTRRV